MIRNRLKPMTKMRQSIMIASGSARQDALSAVEAVKHRENMTQLPSSAPAIDLRRAAGFARQEPAARAGRRATVLPIVDQHHEQRRRSRRSCAGNSSVRRFRCLACARRRACERVRSRRSRRCSCRADSPQRHSRRCDTSPCVSPPYRPSGGWSAGWACPPARRPRGSGFPDSAGRRSGTAARRCRR